MNKVTARTAGKNGAHLMGWILSALFLFGSISVTAVTHTPTLHEKGHLVFEEIFFDFGTVTEGDIVKHTFKLKNTGSENVKIKKIETSCGCTTANGALKEYAPNESGQLEITVDTKGKKGIIVKTVTLMVENNDINPVQISLAMNLVPPPHPKIENARNINTETECKSCHLESGVGQSGVFLYHRVCAQCHGKKGSGGSARALNDSSWQSVSDESIVRVIRQGQPERGMPSYVNGVSPALNDEQVESLLQYIRSLVQH